MRARLAAATVVLALAGCAAIPSSGPVGEVVDDSGLGQSTVRYSPALPADGASPTDIVRGYLDAMLAYPASTRTASAFLTPSAAQDWKPQGGVTIYDGPRVALQTDGARRAEDAEGDAVSVTLDEVGRLDTAGRYVAGRGGRAQVFHLRQIDGEWRIDDPQSGVMVTAKFFGDYFRAFDVFFFDAAAERLVPVPVHVPVDDRLAAALVTSLARGPGEDRLRTFVPPADRLRPTVPVDDGVADVGFEASDTDDTDADRLSAQLVWTLRQVPALEGVRVSIGRETLGSSGSSVQPITAWEQYDRSQLRDRVTALSGNRVVHLVDDDVTAVGGPTGRTISDAPAIAASDDRYALIEPGRSGVRVLDADGGTVLAAAGDRLLDPVVDGDGNFWLLDAGGTRARVVADDTIRTVPTQRLRDVRTFDVSPDGARFAAVVGSGGDARVVVGRIERDADDRVVRLSAPAAVRLDVTAPRDVVWADGVRLALLGTGRSGVQIHTAMIDGSTSTDGSTGGRAVLPDIEPRRLALGSGRDADTYVTDARGRLWYLSSGGTWREVDADPPVRSLASGR